jgi:hypothetical protein
MTFVAVNSDGGGPWQVAFCANPDIKFAGLFFPTKESSVVRAGATLWLKGLQVRHEVGLGKG